MNEVKEMCGQVGSNTSIVVMDAGDGRALRAARLVRAVGRQKVYVLEACPPLLSHHLVLVVKCHSYTSPNVMAKLKLSSSCSDVLFVSPPPTRAHVHEGTHAGSSLFL